MKNLVTILYFIVYWLVIPLIFALAAHSLDAAIYPTRQLNNWMLYPGLIILAYGFSSMCISVYQFKKYSGTYPVSAYPPNNIVQKGIFARLRHPIYSFFVVSMAGLALTMRSIAFTSIIFPMLVLFVYLYLLHEESILRKRFGKSYKLHKKNTPLIFPKIYDLLRLPALLFFKSKFNLQITGTENIPIERPFFVLSTHRNYLDPFIIAAAFPQRIRFVCTFEMFRKPLLKKVLRIIGAIPRKRYLNDISGTRQIIKALKKGQIIGLFPEGGRSWTGAMRTLKPETIHFLRRFSHIPVVPVNLEGNYHAWPRWSKKILGAPVTIRIMEPISIKPEQTHEEILLNLEYEIIPTERNESNLQCASDNFTNNIAISIYRCPVCRTFFSLSPGNYGAVQCKNACNVTLTKNLQIRYRQNAVNVRENIDECYQKIKVRIPDISKLIEAAPQCEALKLKINEKLIHKTMVVWGLENSRYRFQTWKGCFALTTNRLLFSHNMDEAHSIKLKDIDAVTIEGNNILQIYNSKIRQLYQAVFDSESALFWQDLLSLYIKHQLDKSITTR